jgi:hypothetical protein
MSDRLALANAIEDADIERGAPAAEPLFVTCMCSSYRAREGEAA